MSIFIQAGESSIITAINYVYTYIVAVPAGCHLVRNRPIKPDQSEWSSFEGKYYIKGLILGKNTVPVAPTGGLA